MARRPAWCKSRMVSADGRLSASATGARRANRGAISRALAINLDWDAPETWLLAIFLSCIFLFLSSVTRSITKSCFNDDQKSGTVRNLTPDMSFLAAAAGSESQPVAARTPFRAALHPRSFVTSFLRMAMSWE